MDKEKQLTNLKNARVLVNDGCNEQGCHLSGESCKAIVRWIDEAIVYLIELDEDVVSRSEYENCRNELCYKCGEYKNRHLGACDGCRWLE